MLILAGPSSAMISASCSLVTLDWQSPCAVLLQMLGSTIKFQMRWQVQFNYIVSEWQVHF